MYSIAPHHDQLANKSVRLIAAVLDAVLLAGVLLPVQYMTGYLQKAIDQQLSPQGYFAGSAIGICGYLILNGYLLAARGQTIGKFAAQIQIVDANNGCLLSFFRVCICRYLWSFPLSTLAFFTPGTISTPIVQAIILIDVLWIFGNHQRCLHDHIANSKVVLYRYDRI